LGVRVRLPLWAQKSEERLFAFFIRCLIDNSQSLVATVYVLYSDSLNCYYVGSCLDLRNRIKEHNSGSYNNAFTKRADDWEVFFVSEGLEYQQARDIEKHIKKMKSRVYIENLKRFPELIERLKMKF
jgi:putative endonuclease